MIPARKLTAAVETYFGDLRRLRASGGATDERSTYVALANLLTAVGGSLKPKVFCVVELADQGSGHPDMGLYAAKQVQKGKPRQGQVPERGVVEVKSVQTALGGAEVREQVDRYRARYRLVLATNLREFELVGRTAAGEEVKLEAFRLAASEAGFDRLLETPRASAQRCGAGLGEYLARALSHRAALADPKDLAWLLASYARDGLARVERAGDSPSLGTVRSALEEALGVRFEGAKGARFFHSTLVQTLFYGVFSAWVLWSRQAPPRGEVFDWRTAVWHLRAPVLRALFQQLADPGRLEPLGLVEVLDWTAAALNRVDRPAFFASFNEGEAVPYFYEPFLQAFDPALRKQLGVWYTPAEVVQYMVARVDKALRDDLEIPDGLAADNVYVLDPCCGTGAYLAEVLKRIAANLEGRGLGALAGARVKQAATERVFGFEIMPAPFVIAHLQVGLTMQELGAPLAEKGDERAGVFLTNALTGWEPRSNKPLPFPELEEERDRAEKVKQEAPILVILGNPPYNGFPGTAMEEERELTDAYRATKRVRRPEGRGLNDLYVRFFRMAERRIAEKTGQGVVCFISNYSWLDGLSFTGMRERYAEAFDCVRIDCLNGDKYKTGKVAPDGSSDPSIFSTEGNPVGIQVGTSIATLVRKADHQSAPEVRFRHLWGRAKREELTATAESEPDELYEAVAPSLPLGMPFLRTAVDERWFDWPALPDLFPKRFHGVLTNRDAFLVDVDLDRLRERIGDYFDPGLSHEEIERRYPSAMKSTARFDARAGRDELLARGGPVEDGFCRITYRPFDDRWLYWEDETGLFDRPRPDYRRHVAPENLWLTASQHVRKDASEPQAVFTRHLGSHHLIERGSNLFPAYLRQEAATVGGNGLLANAGEPLANRDGLLPNVSASARRYLNRIGATVEDLFHFTLATLHDADYRTANADGLRLGWPRIPLPGWPEGGDAGSEAAERFAASVERGREIAHLLDPDTPVPGVTTGDLRPEIAAIAVPTTVDGRQMTGDDFALTAGWGHFGTGRAVMPGQGRAVERSYTVAERTALGDAASALGESTFDVYLNDRAYWRNVPAAVWEYRLGGYQVLKKWLSYRALGIVGRRLRFGEAQCLADIARRTAGTLVTTRSEVSGAQRTESRSEKCP